MAVVATSFIFLQTVPGQLLDQFAYRMAWRVEERYLTVGDAVRPSLKLGALAVVVCVVMVHVGRGRYRDGARVAAMAAVVVCLVLLLKVIVLQRAQLDLGPTENTMPSGHVGVTAAAAAAARDVVPPDRFRVWLWCGAGFVGVTALVSTLERAHRFSDSIVGLGIAVAVAALMLPATRGRLARPTGRAYVTVVMGSVLVTACGATALLVFRPRSLDGPWGGIGLAVAACAVVGAVTAGMGWLAALRPDRPGAVEPPVAS